MVAYNQAATIYTLLKSINNRKVYIPMLRDYPNRRVEQQINQQIRQAVSQLMRDQEGYQTVNGIQEVYAGYEIKNNQRGILSLTLFNYTYTYPMAHGLTLMSSFNFNLQTGENYSLEALFKPNSYYVERLSDIVKQQINEQDLPLIDEFTSIKPDQPFYLADKTLVLYFQIYEITPYYVGIPMFPILIQQLEDIIDPDGPLQTLLPAVPAYD